MQLERQAQGEEARLIGQLWRDAYLTADEEAITRLCDESNRHAGSKSP